MNHNIITKLEKYPYSVEFIDGELWHYTSKVDDCLDKDCAKCLLRHTATIKPEDVINRCPWCDSTGGKYYGSSHYNGEYVFKYGCNSKIHVCTLYNDVTCNTVTSYLRSQTCQMMTDVISKEEDLI